MAGEKGRLHRLRVELKNSLRVPADGRVIAAMNAKGAFAEALSWIAAGSSRSSALASLRSRYWKRQAQPQHTGEVSRREPLGRYVVMTLRAAADADQLHEVEAFRDMHLDGGVLLAPEDEPRGIRQHADLRGAARLLSERFGWDEKAATEFVLYGWIPKPFKYTFEKRPDGIPNRIILDLDEHATVEDVKPLLLAAKAEADRLRGGKARALTDKALLQAAFALEVNTDWTWGAAQAEWNARYPMHAYREADSANFQGHVHEAVERVYGAKLVWYGQEHRPPTKAERALCLAERVFEDQLADLHPVSGEPLLKGKARARVEVRLENARRRYADSVQTPAGDT